MKISIVIFITLGPMAIIWKHLSQTEIKQEEKEKLVKTYGCIITAIFENFKAVENINRSSKCSLTLDSNDED